MCRWLIALVILVVIVVFSINNKDAVVIDLGPTPFEIEIPLYLLVMSTLIVGTVLGGLTQSLRRKKPAGHKLRAGHR